MWAIIERLVTGGLSALLGTIGKTVTDIHADNTTRYRNENEAGNQLATTVTDGYGRAADTRARVQQSQGTWGPFGIAGFIIAMSFAFHVVMIVMDSTSWHLIPTVKWYILPWLEWQPHVVGSWRVSALPPPFDATEHEILKALFYVGPPSAAVMIAAKAFRR